MALLTRLGAAGESLAMDRMLKANTAKTRTHALFRPGCVYFAAIPTMPGARLTPLIQRFGEYLPREPVRPQFRSQMRGWFRVKAA